MGEITSKGGPIYKNKSMIMICVTINSLIGIYNYNYMYIYITTLINVGVLCYISCDGE